MPHAAPSPFQPSQFNMQRASTALNPGLPSCNRARILLNPNNLYRFLKTGGFMCRTLPPGEPCVCVCVRPHMHLSYARIYMYKLSPTLLGQCISYMNQ
jgi:hypothetical protein